MDPAKALELFEKKYGTIEEYQGDYQAYRKDLRLFCIGWLAGEEAVKHSVQRTAYGYRLQVTFAILITLINLALVWLGSL